MADLKDILNSRSMMTPGIAGAIAMLITDTLYQQFDLPARWIGLVLSFLLGLLVFRDTEPPVWQRCLYYVVNSLIIFSMAVGAKTTGEGVIGAGQHFGPGGPTFFEPWF